MIFSVDTTINYGRYDQNQSIVTQDKVFVFPVWIIIIILVVLVIYVLKKKEVSSPLNIKIERKKNDNNPKISTVNHRDMGWDKNIYDFGLADKNKNMIPSNKFFLER